MWLLTPMYPPCEPGLAVVGADEVVVYLMKANILLVIKNNEQKIKNTPGA
jgi:hypothetical protein